MATEIVDNKVDNLFNKLESQQTVLSTCTNLYKTLTSHFTILNQSLISKSETLDSRILTLDSDYEKSLEDLKIREDSVPERLSSLTSLVETRKEAALTDFEKQAPGEDAPLADALKSVCRRMDHLGLLKLAVSRRKESVALRAEMADALAEAVDPARLVLDTVHEFVDLKARSKGGLTDKRWACAMVVGGMFPLEELKEKKGSGGPAFSRKLVEQAEAVVRQWRTTAEKLSARVAGGGGGGGCEELSGMGPAEASIFLQILIGFGLKDKFEEEFIRKLVMEFSIRRDMPKLAISLFGDRIGDIVDDLVKNGKQVEAAYFATECGLTERFQPVSLLKSAVQSSKDIASDILKKGNRTHAAAEEANLYEINSVKSIIKCVEDHNMESEFPLESLRKRLTVLERTKADKKRSSVAVSTKPSNKRAHGGGPPPHRASKMSRFSSSYSSYGQRNTISPGQPNTGSRYPAPYNNYPSYDTGVNSSSYGPSYGGSHVPPTGQVTQQQYGVPSESVAGSYGGHQTGYGSYNYASAAGAGAGVGAAPPSYG